MEFYIGNTDKQLYDFLRTRNPEDINFWQPGGRMRFHILKSGAPFLLRLKSPINKIAGIGFFSSHSLLPIDFAWEVFQQRNGVESLDSFRKKINSFREINNSLDVHPQIGCLVLSNPVFFNETDWQPTPPDWHINLVQGKRYDSTFGYGKLLWENIESLLFKYRLFDHQKDLENQFVVEEENLANRYGSEILTRVRLGQGAFRVLITDAYDRKCAISVERTLPVLDWQKHVPYPPCTVTVFWPASWRVPGLCPVLA